MARFYGLVRGRAQTEATRLGHSEISGWIGGWGMVCRIYCWRNDKDEDMMRVTLTEHPQKYSNKDDVLLYDGPADIDKASKFWRTNRRIQAKALGITWEDRERHKADIAHMQERLDRARLDVQAAKDEAEEARRFPEACLTDFNGDDHSWLTHEYIVSGSPDTIEPVA